MLSAVNAVNLVNTVNAVKNAAAARRRGTSQFRNYDCSDSER
jgi:hypothetical protein